MAEFRLKHCSHFFLLAKIRGKLLIPFISIVICVVISSHFSIKEKSVVCFIQELCITIDVNA